MASSPWVTIEDERLRRVADYWDLVRGDRMLPFRADLKFATYPDLAADCSILSRKRDGELRYWYAGTETVQRADREVTGLNIFDMYPPPLRQPFDAWLSTAFSLPCAYTCHFSADMPNGGQGHHRSLSLPLNGPDGVVRYVLSVIRSDRDEMGARLDHFFGNVSRMQIQPLDIGAGCPAPIDVTAATDFT